MPDPDADVFPSKISKKSMIRRELRAIKTAKVSKLHVMRIWTRMAHEERTLARILTGLLKIPDIENACAVSKTLFNLRSQMIDISGLPRRPGGDSRQKPTIPALSVEEIGLYSDPKPAENTENAGENRPNPGDSKSAGVPPDPEITPELPPDLPE